jgi:hypothetical protein
VTARPANTAITRPAAIQIRRLDDGGRGMLISAIIASTVAGMKHASRGGVDAC